MKLESIQFEIFSNNNQKAIDSVTALVGEYFEWGNRMLKKHYGYELNIQEMLSTFINELPKYCLGDTRLYLVNLEDVTIGLGGFKKKDNAAVELKRVFVQEKYRGNGIGRELVRTLVQDARDFGYKKMYLESADFMEAAFTIYQSIGFNKIPNYEGIETPGQHASNIYCMELILNDNSDK